MARQTKPAGVGYPSANEIRANPIPIRVTSSKAMSVKPTTVLALDLSSSCIGWAVGIDKNLVAYGKFVFKTTSAINGDKLATFISYLTVILETYGPQKVLVEKTLMGKGDTTVRHLEILGVVRATVFKILGLEILESWLIPAKTVKRLLKVKKGRDHAHNKQIMVEKINQLFNLRLKCESSKIESDDDIADAIAVLVAYYRRGQSQ
jgi:Holliday junction resolvasome RuvABC endonuclease subunit